ncbi:transposase [Pelagibaculum spongiae]|uniref:Transposase n=1 Tax=Pelagibaculum spongiae TaxID=2080658 RepID=A0A2V1GZK1_9GAMM|nr:hypothetical protein DC094_16140 [Pelagibaculum spongiae]
MIYSKLMHYTSTSQVQCCISHMTRSSMKFVPYKDYKAVTSDLKKIYRLVTVA